MNRILKAITAAIVGCLCLVAVLAPLKAEPVKIRLGYGIIPGVISPLLFQKPEILKHYDKSYTVESTYIRATSIARAPDPIGSGGRAPGEGLHCPVQRAGYCGR